MTIEERMVKVLTWYDNKWGYLVFLHRSMHNRDAKGNKIFVAFWR